MIRDDVYVVVLWTFIKNGAFIVFGQVRHAISIWNEYRCVLNIYGKFWEFETIVKWFVYKTIEKSFPIEQF